MYQRLANFDAVPCSKPSMVPRQTRGAYGLCGDCHRKFKIKQNSTLYKHKSPYGATCIGSGHSPLIMFSKCPAGHDISYNPVTRMIDQHGVCIFGNRKANLDHLGHVRSVV